MAIAIKRAYEPAAESDGFRILVDRLWPRGVSKAEAHFDLWAKSTAPSTALRKWFAHDPAKWVAFQAKYEAELAANPAFAELKAVVKAHEQVTLVYAARDEVHNEAAVLQKMLKGH